MSSYITIFLIVQLHSHMSSCIIIQLLIWLYHTWSIYDYNWSVISNWGIWVHIIIIIIMNLYTTGSISQNADKCWVIRSYLSFVYVICFITHQLHYVGVHIWSYKFSCDCAILFITYKLCHVTCELIYYHTTFHLVIIFRWFIID